MNILDKKLNNEPSIPTFFESMGMSFPASFTSFTNEFNKQVKDFYTAFNKSEDSTNLYPGLTQARSQIEKYWSDFYAAFPINSEFTALSLQPFKDGFDKYLKAISTNFPMYSEFTNMFTSYPSISISNEDTEFKVEAGIPGFDEKSIKITIQNGTLTIKGEQKITSKDKTTPDTSCKFFERTITLPNNIDIRKAKASFKNGMLWVIFPKDSKAQEQIYELSVEKITN